MNAASKPAMRMAVIGCGDIGRLHAQAIEQSPHAQLVAVCDIDQAAADRLAMSTGAFPYNSLESLLRSQQLDAITVATPDALHVEPVLAAIERGLHVFCEKPLATSLQEGLLIINAAESNRVHIGVDYNRRFGFGYQQAKERIRNHLTWTLRQAIVHVSDGIPLKVASQSYALLTSLVSHHLDLLRWLGGEIHSLHAKFRGPDPRHPHHVVIVLEYFEGALGSLTADWRHGQTRTYEELRLVADDCVILIDDVQREVQVWHESPDNTEVFRPSSFAYGNHFYDTVFLHVLAFIEALATHREPPVNGHDAIRTLQMIEAAIESDRTGKWIELPHVL